MRLALSVLQDLRSCVQCSEFHLVHGCSVTLLLSPTLVVELLANYGSNK